MVDQSRIDHPLADRRVRGAIGLASGLVIAGISILFFEGILLWVGLGIAAVDTILVPYSLGKAVENAAKPKTETVN